MAFVSDMYGEKASNKHIFIESSILNKCEIDDAISKHMMLSLSVNSTTYI